MKDAIAKAKIEDHVHFEDATAADLREPDAYALLSADWGEWNSCPGNAAFLSYMEVYPEARAHGYIIGGHRADKRITIEGLSLTKDATDEQRLTFMEQFNGANELDRTRCWYD